MRSSHPSAAAVVAHVDSLGPPGTPLTAAEIADDLAAPTHTVETVLDDLVTEAVLETKLVDGRCRVWWRPSRAVAESVPDDEQSVRFDSDQSTSAIRHLKRRLNALESELSEVLERISDGVYSLDTNYRFQYINDHAETLLGVEESTARGCDIRETIETTETFRRLLEQALDDQEPVFFEDYYEPLDGWFDNAIYPSETGVSIYFRDISDRKRLEQELRTETEHFEVALQNSPVSAFRLDTDLRYTWVGNPRHRFVKTEVLGKRDDELLEPEAAEVVMAPKQQVLETGEGVRQEVTYDLPSGTVTYDLTIEPLYDISGEISGLTATAVDLTESIQQQTALRRSEQKLRLALREAAMGTWELDVRTNEATSHSPHHDRIFGYDEPVDDWTLARFLDHVYPDDREFVERRFNEAFETGSWTFECRITRADGIERWIAVDSDVQSDADGEPDRIVGIVRDITDRKRRQQVLKESEQRYRLLIENFPHGGVSLLDDDLRHTIVDGRGFETLGFDVEALRGERVRDAFPDEVVNELVSQYRATLDGDQRTFELQIGDRICAFRTLPLTNADGVFAVLSIFHDITLQKRQQQRQLSTQTRIHEIVQDIAHLIIESPTQADIEAVVCERFDDTDAYSAAWIGQLNHGGETVLPSTVSGDDGDWSVLTITADGDEQTIAGPISRAIETAESQLIHTGPTDPVYAHHSESTPLVHQPGVVIPIRYGVHVYGVLVVYSDRPDAFGRREREPLDHLGTIIGHAINSIERKQALIADRVTEVIVRSEAIAQPFIEGADSDALTVSIDQVMILSGGRSLVYYTVEGIKPRQFIEIIEGFAPDSEIRLLDGDRTRSRFELSTDTETIHSVVATYGGRITEVTLRGEVFGLTLQLPNSVDVRRVLDAARTVYPDLRLVSQSTVTPPRRTLNDTFALLDEQLTDRQRQTLEVGYYAGFFEWPRETSGDNLAELMGVTPATVHHHLRHGQQKLLSAFFDADLSLSRL